MSQEKMDVIEVVKHYQRSIEKNLGNEPRILHCIKKLYNLPVTVQHLQDTGVGRTVNALRKYDGETGESAKALVMKWKAMVAAEETSESEEDEDDDSEESEESDEEEDEVEAAPEIDEDSGVSEPEAELEAESESDPEHEPEPKRKSEPKLEPVPVKLDSSRHKSSYTGDKREASDHHKKHKSSHDHSSSSHSHKNTREEKSNHHKSSKHKDHSHKRAIAEEGRKEEEKRKRKRIENNESSDEEPKRGIGEEAKKEEERRKRRKRESRESSDEPMEEDEQRDSENSNRRNDTSEEEEEQVDVRTKIPSPQFSVQSKSHKSNHHDNRHSSSHSHSNHNKVNHSSHSSHKNHSESHQKNEKHREKTVSEDKHHLKSDHKKKESSSKTESKNVNSNSSSSKEVKVKKEKEKHKEKHKHEEKKREEIKRESKDKNDRSEKSVKSEKKEINEKNERSSKSEKSEKIAKSDKSEKSEKIAKSDKSEKSEKIAKSDKSEKSEKIAKSDKSEKNEKSGKSEKNLKSEKSSKSEKDKSKSDSHIPKHSEKPSGSSSSSKSESKSKVPKTKKVVVDVPEEGIDSFSGTSFADALGSIPMADSSKKKKKVSLPSSSTNCSATKRGDEHSSPSTSGHRLKDISSSKAVTKVPASPDDLDLLSSALKLDPLECEMEVDVDVTLPAITPNYRPLPHVNQDGPSRARARPLTEEEALSQVMSTKNQRTKVYSGVKSGKSWSKVPSLYDICVRVLQENIEALEYTGGVPYDLLKPVLMHANPNQLYSLEYYNEYLISDTDELWKQHCERVFRSQTRQEMETYREMFQRCSEEREHKLNSLTNTIKKNQAASLPVRQTKLAYMESIAKPPRQVARKQAKFGTAHDVQTTPMAKIQKLASPAASSAGGPVVTVPTPRGSGGSSHSVAKTKPKVAPLMQKTLKFAKSFKR